MGNDDLKDKCQGKNSSESHEQSVDDDDKKLGGKIVVACPTFGWADIKEAPKLFTELCDLADSLDLKLALEFMAWAETIKDIKTAWSVVEKAGRANGGILFDTFHLK